MNETDAESVKTTLSGRWVGSFVTLLATSIICLTLLEAAARILMGVPLFGTSNWRQTQIVAGNFNGGVEFHETLGWQMAGDIKSDGFNTIEYGIRKNGDDTQLTTGGILAVGDSFTAGSEVDDWESWPAYLEQKLETPVVNGGVGGYGTDQILLRAEQLLPIVKPKVLIAGFLQDDILRAAYSSYGRPKPYFEVRDGALVMHPPTLASFDKVTGGFSDRVNKAVQRWGGHSALLHSVLGRLAPEFWLASKGQVYTRVSIDEVEVTCKLLERVKSKTDELGVRMLLFMQYGGGHNAALSPPTSHAQLVMDCAEAHGIQVVDELPSLQAVVKEDPAKLRDYYVMQGDVYGHMSATGNLHAAGLLTDALKQDYEPNGSAQPAQIATLSTEMPVYETLETRISGSEIVRVEEINGLFSSHHRLTAIGPKGEHYAAVGGIQSPPGVTTFSMLVRFSDSSALVNEQTSLRIQLWDEEGQAIFADFNLSSEETALERVGLTRRLRSTIESEGWNWKRITVSAKFAGSGRTVYLQFMDKERNSSIEAKNRALDIAELKLY